MSGTGSRETVPLGESEMLRLLMDSHADHIYFKDLEGRFLRINSAQARWFGLDSPEEAVGKTDQDFFADEHARDARADEERIIRTGLPMIGKVEMETWPDGRRTWVSTTKFPIRNKSGVIIGTFGVSRDVTEQHLKDEQLSRAVENLRQVNERYRQELALAGDVMSALAANRLESFPEHASRPNIRFHYRYSAAEQLSGDFFVVAPYNATSAIVFLCDVMGHGVSAALIAAIMRVWVGQMVRKETPPGVILSTLNRRVHALFSEPDTLRFATAFCGVVDAARGLLRYAAAGHPSPILVEQSPAGAHTLYDSRGKGPGLGLQQAMDYEESEAALPPGSTLLVFSDGLVEGDATRVQVHSPELELCDRLARQTGLSAAALVNDLFSSARAGSRADMQDDICLVAVEMMR